MIDAGWTTELRRRPRLTSWVVVTIGLGLYLALADDRAFVFDSGFYYFLKDTFGTPLAVLDFDNQLRGYAFPWHLRLVSWALGPFTDDRNLVVRAMTFVSVPLLLCVVVPTLARRVSSSTALTVTRIVGGSVVFLVLWRNDLLYPLADIGALFFMASGAMLLLAKRPSTTFAAATAVVAGLAFGWAVNYRPSYLLAVVVATALLFLVERDGRRLVLRTVAVVVGLALALGPQVALNLRHHDSVSPTPVASSDLALFQLEEGLRYDRYESYYGDGDDLPSPRLIFLNDSLASEMQTTTFESNGDYLEFVSEHPLDVVALYGRHLFNGLDARFGGSAVENLHDRSLLLPALNYLVLIAAVWLVVRRWAHRSSTVWRGPTTWFVVVLATSVLPAVVGAVEARFLLPLHLTLIASVALTFRRRDLPAPGRPRVATAAAVVVAVFACFALSAATLSSQATRPILADGRLAELPEGVPPPPVPPVRPITP